MTSRRRPPALMPAGHDAAAVALPVPRPGADLPALLDAGSQALAAATDDLERLRIRDHAQAIGAAARVLKRIDVLVDASVLVHTAERTIAAVNPAPTPAEAGGRNGAAVVETEVGAGLIRKIRGAHARVDDDLFASLVDEARRLGEPLTRRRIARAGREAQGLSSPKTLGYGGDYERVVPPHIAASAFRAMGGIDLDPASTARANTVVKAQRFLTEREDGLKRAWRGRVWLNPPFSRGLVDAFVARLLDRLAIGQVTQAVLLTNNSTDTAWWQAAAAEARAVCLLAGRLNFLNAELHPVGPWAIQGQSVMYFATPGHVRTNVFAGQFRRHGLVLRSSGVHRA